MHTINWLILFILVLINIIATNQQQQDYTISQQYTTTIPIQDNNEQLLNVNYQSISQSLQHLSLQTQPVYPNRFINKSVSIQSNQVLMYQSGMISPIYVLDKEHCHSHQGTILIQQLQHISSHSINQFNHYSQGNVNSQQGINKNSQQVKQTIDIKDKVNQVNQQLEDDNQQQQILFNSFIYNKKYKTLYKLNPNSLKLTAYTVNQQTLNSKLSLLSQTQSQINTNQNNNHHQQFDYYDSHQNGQNNINVYNNNNKSITLLTSISLIDIQPGALYNQCMQSSSVKLLLSKSYQTLFIFTCTAIYMVKCQSVLSKIQPLMVFNKQSNKQFNKLFNGIEVETVNGYVFWLSQSQGIRIYGLTLEQKLQYITTINVSQIQINSINRNIKNSINKKDISNNRNKNNTLINQNNNLLPFSIKLSSMEYNNGLLYILTKNYGILVYQRQISFKFKLINYIDYLPQHINKINYQIIVKDSLMLIWTKLKKWQFITQIKIINKNLKDNNDQQKQSNSNNNYAQSIVNQYVLNRYFKGYRSINKIEVIKQFDISRQLSNNNKVQKKQVNNKQFKLQSQVLLISSQKGIQVYPLGVDVREISSMMNGVVNNHIRDDYMQMVQINKNIWVIQKLLSNTGNIKQTKVDKQQQEKQTKIDQTNRIDESNNQGQYKQKGNILTQVYIGGLQIVYPSIECTFTQPGNYTLLIQQSYSLYQQQQNNKNTQNALTDDNRQAINQDNKNNNNNSVGSSFHFQPHLYYRVSVIVSSTQSYLTMYISLLSIILLLLIISLLIYWREKKLNLIDNIVSQIRRINASKRNHHHQFNQQNSIDKKWNQLKQQILDQVSYKVIDQVSYKVNEQNIDLNDQDVHMSSQRGLTRQLYSLDNKNFTLFSTNNKSNQHQNQHKLYEQSFIQKKSQQNIKVQSQQNKQVQHRQQTIKQQKRQGQNIEFKQNNFSIKSTNKISTQHNINNIKLNEQIQIDNQYPQQQQRRTLHSDLQINDNSLLYKQLHQQRQSHQQNSISADDFNDNLTSSQQKHVNLSILEQDNIS